MKFGYARVSKSDQSLDLQIQKLKIAGCEEIYVFDKSSHIPQSEEPSLLFLTSVCCTLSVKRSI